MPCLSVLGMDMEREKGHGVIKGLWREVGQEDTIVDMMCIYTSCQKPSVPRVTFTVFF